jgi:hypothetical protein
MNLAIAPDPSGAATSVAGASFAQDIPLIHSDGTSMIIRGPVARQWARIAQRAKNTIRLAYVRKHDRVWFCRGVDIANHWRRVHPLARRSLKVVRGQERAQVSDIFNSWGCLASLLIYTLMSLVANIALVYMLSTIGLLASIALSFAMIPGVYAIIDSNLSVMDALKWSIETIKTNFGVWLIAYLVGDIIAIAGLIALIIGVIFTIPLGTLIYTCLYEKLKPAKC